MNTNTNTKTASSSRTGRTNTSKTTLVKGPKPLLKFKFYLDVKNHGVSSKLEAKIKSLGGVIEVFLVEEVTHVITDRELCPPGVNSPQLRSVESLGSNESPQGTVSGGSLRQKTRADAMLEKVRAQATNKPSDPLHSAKQWCIPIWTVQRVLTWLDKVTASLDTAKSRRVKLISIKAPFLKFEPLLRDGRPVYKPLQAWPQIDLEADSCKPAFFIKNNNISERGKEQDLELDGTNDDRMTRKQRTRLSVRNGNKETEVDKQALVGGFCEICHCEYREIGEHVRSEQHLNFVKNDANFLELDTLISAGANVEAFLRLNGNSGKDLNNYPLFGRRSLRKLNGKNTPEKYNGTGLVKRNKMPRTSSNQSPLSTAESESGHHLRSRGQLWLPPNLLGTTAEDEPYSNKAKHERKSSCRLSEDDTKNTKENAHSSENTRPKRTCPKTKRISADERLVADNKTYYKVEVMTTKLRSSGLGNREHELARRVQTPIPEEEPDDSDDGLVVKFKRVRRSELSVLNDEAENFMFPRKDDTGLSDVDTDEAPNTTRSTIRCDTSEIKSSEVDVKLLRQESVVDDCTNASSDATPRRRTRNGTRLDVAECEEDTGSVEVENASARRRRTRADTKCEQEEIDVDLSKRRTRNDTKADLEDLEDTNDMDSGDNYDNSRKRRTRNDTKVELEDSDDHSELEIFPKRLKRTTSKSEQDLDDSIASESRKRRRAKSETPDLDDHEMELRKKRRKVYTEHEEEVKEDENSADSATDDNMPRKKRRTQAEAFIADNQRYYRFETPGSRLRYQGSSKPDATEKPAAESGDEQAVQVDHDQLVRMPRDSLKFSFELLPKSEPWYCTFQRQDKGEEFYTCVSDPGYSHRFYLPYQFSYLMPLDPKICIEEYKQKRESYIKSEAAKLDVTVDSPLQSLDSPAPSESVTEKSNESDKPLSEIQIMKRRRKRRLYANHPRKSPRQHASTLAILSSLIQQRKKRARKSDSSLASIPEEVTPQALVMDETSQCLSDSGLDPALEAILTAPMDDLSDLEYHDVDGIVIRDKPDAIELLTNYNTAVPMSNPENRTATRTETVRVVRRKRKKNRTGWPKKKRLFVKRTELKCEDGNSSALELEERRLSVEEEPGEIDSATCTEPRIVDEQCAEGETNTCNALSGEEERLAVIDSGAITSTDRSNNELVSRDNNNSDILTVKVKQENDEPLIVITNTTLADLHNVKQEDVSVKTEVSDDSDTAEADYQKLAVILPCRKSQRNNSSDCSIAEEVIASQTDKLTACVHVALDKWENAEKVLHAKMSENETVPNEKLLQYQPFVRVQKIEHSTLALQNANRRLRSSASPERKLKSKRPRTLAASPRTPRKLRAPRGKWYRER